MKIKWNFTVSNPHTTRKSSLFIFISTEHVYQWESFSTVQESPMNWFSERDCCVEKKLENTQKAVFIPTNEGIFPLFRHVNATTARRLLGEVKKFQCLWHAQCHCSIVECFKTKIIDFKSFSTSSCCYCWCLLFHSLSLMKCDVFFLFLYAWRQWEIVIRYFFWEGIDYEMSSMLSRATSYMNEKCMQIE